MTINRRTFDRCPARRQRRCSACRSRHAPRARSRRSRSAARCASASRRRRRGSPRTRSPATGRRGVGVSLGKAMADDLGVKFEPVEVSWGTAIAALQGNKIDMMFDDRRHARAQAGGRLPEDAAALLLARRARARRPAGEDLGRSQQARACASPCRRPAHGPVPDASTSPRPTSQRFPGNAEAIAAFQAGPRRRGVPVPPAAARGAPEARQGQDRRADAGAVAGLERRAAQGADKSFVAWVDKQLAEFYKSGQTQKWYEEFLVDFGLDPKLAAAGHEGDARQVVARRLRARTPCSRYARRLPMLPLELRAGRRRTPTCWRTACSTR